MHKAFQHGLLAAALTMAGAAQAGTVMGSDLLGGPQALGGGATVSASGSGSLCTKFYFDNVTVLGVDGGYAGCEIDVGETLSLSFSQAVQVSNVNLGLLYAGPVFDNVQEKGRLTATLADHSTIVSYIMATDDTTAWVSQGTVLNVQPAVQYSGGQWSWADPFGNAAVTSITFEAVPSVPRADCPWCSVQSSYGLYSVTADVAPVPEPGTMALGLAGVGVIGFLLRRRRHG